MRGAVAQRWLDELAAGVEHNRRHPSRAGRTRRGRASRRRSLPCRGGIDGRTEQAGSIATGVIRCLGCSTPVGAGPSQAFAASLLRA